MGAKGGFGKTLDERDWTGPSPRPTSSVVIFLSSAVWEGMNPDLPADHALTPCVLHPVIISDPTSWKSPASQEGFGVITVSRGAGFLNLDSNPWSPCGVPA